MGVLLVATLTACGSSGDEAPAEKPTTSESPEATYVESDDCRERGGAVLDAIDQALDDTEVATLERRVDGIEPTAETELAGCSEDVLDRTLAALDSLVEAVEAANRGDQDAVTNAMTTAQNQATAARLSLDKTG